MADSTRLFGICTDVLEVVRAGLAGAGQPVPERRYVSDGNLVAWDCEQLVVACEATLSHEGNVSQELQSPAIAMAMRAAVLGIWICRCCPVMADDGEPPPAADITASAGIALADPVVMVDALWEAHRTSGLGSCQGLAFRQWQAVGPAGGLTGGVLRIVVNLTGI